MLLPASSEVKGDLPDRQMLIEGRKVLEKSRPASGSQGQYEHENQNVTARERMDSRSLRDMI
jgi:hypothetical protein